VQFDLAENPLRFGSRGTGRARKTMTPGGRPNNLE